MPSAPPSPTIRVVPAAGFREVAATGARSDSRPRVLMRGAEMRTKRVAEIAEAAARNVRAR